MLKEPEILQVPFGRIQPWGKNPRNIKTEELKKLAKSLQTKGQFQVLTCWENGNGYETGGGNMRWQAMKNILEYPDDKPTWISLNYPESEAEKIELALLDNMRFGTYMEDELAELVYPHIDEIDLSDYKVDLGEPASLEDLISDYGPDAEGEDEVPEIDDSPAITKQGDLFLLGEHRLLCGDATKEEDVKRLMDGKKADMVFTDPPYNVDYKGMQNSKQWDSIANDMMSSVDFETFLIKAFTNYYNFSSFNAGCYICHADKSHKEFRNAFEQVGYEWRATIIWVKNSPAFNFAQYKYKHEPIFYCYKKGQAVNWFGDRTQNTVWGADKERGEHPTIKPVMLISKAIENSSPREGLVMDLFGGSGSTLIACEKLNRKCYGMEIEPKYCDVIIKRYADYADTSEEKIRETVQHVTS